MPKNKGENNMSKNNSNQRQVNSIEHPHFRIFNYGEKPKEGISWATCEKKPFSQFNPWWLHRHTPDGTDVIYNKEGVIIYSSYANGEIEWRNRDRQKVFTKSSDGTERWYDSDEMIVRSARNQRTTSFFNPISWDHHENGNVKWVEHNVYNGEEKFPFTLKFDKNGNMIHAKDGYSGIEIWYHLNGIISHVKYWDKTENWFDEKGRSVRSRGSDGSEVKYDSSCCIKYVKTPDGVRTWYDMYGQRTRIISKEGEMLFRYDKDGREIYRKAPDGEEEWNDYYEDGIVVTRYRLPTGDEKIFTYDGTELIYSKDTATGEVFEKYTL